MEKKKIICDTDSPAQTKKIGNLLAKTVLNRGVGDAALVLLLRGDLGAGKTQFIQGLAKGLGIEETVNSPTFTIMKKYPANKGVWKHLYHVDCYRLDSGRDLVELGLAKILADPAAVVAIEWPSVAEKGMIFNNALEILIEVVDAAKRRIVFDF